LFYAAEIASVPITQLLLNHPKIDVTLRNKEGSSALHAAASGGHVGIMTALLDRGLDATDTNDVRT
jgi:ankyrin repeat protein